MASAQKNCEASKDSDNLYNSVPLDYLRDPDTCSDPQHKVLLSFAEKSRQYHRFTRQEKLEKLGMHSMCKLNTCKCIGWRTPEETSSTVKLKNVNCDICHHTLFNHYSHIQNHPDSFLNYLLDTVIELESINTFCFTEKDKSTLDAYSVLGKALQKSIAYTIKPDVAELIGKPPFEETTIAQIMRSFILCKYTNFNEKELQNVVICAQIVLHYINSFILMKASKWIVYFPESDFRLYELSYIRWLCYCNFPKIYKSFELFDMVDIFGPRFLKVIYRCFQQTTYYKMEMEMINEEIKDCILRLIDAFGKELENESSSIWTLFDHPVVNHLVPDYIIAKPYAFLCPTLASNDLMDKVKEVFSPDFSPGSLPPCEDLPSGVPEDIVKDAIRNVKDLTRMNKQNNPDEEESKNNKEHTEIDVYFLSNSESSKMSAANMHILTSLIDVFVYLLPEIPKELITRYVFDVNYTCLALVRRKEVIGGICFRMYPEQNFSEVIFWGILSVRGYGAYMVNHLKDFHLMHDIHYFLLYATNDIIPFFEKQGFTTEISVDRRLCDKYMKVFTGTTLMECKLDPEITYTALTNVTDVQIHIMKELIKRRSKSKQKLPPVPIDSKDSKNDK